MTFDELDELRREYVAAAERCEDLHARAILAGPGSYQARQFFDVFGYALNLGLRYEDALKQFRPVEATA